MPSYRALPPSTSSTYKIQNLEKELRFLRQLCPTVIGSLLLSAEGLPVASDLPEPFEDEYMAARAAAMMALCERIVGELKRGELELLLINGVEGPITFVRVSDHVALAVLCQPETRIGVMLLDLAYAVSQLRLLLE